MRSRITRTLFAALVVLTWAAISLSTHGATTPVAPDEVDGLLAWYDARALYEKVRDREAVSRWPDSSGNGHDLTEEGGGLKSVFRALQVGEKPAIKIGKGSSFAVANPFALGDHTIFLVYRANSPTMGLFSAARNGQLGVVIARDGQRHLIHAGTRESDYNATSATSATGVRPGFSITTLTREGGRLGAFIDGLDVSGDGKDDTALEVGRLFHVALSRAVSRDAEGMRVADLIFYGRRLTDAEREGITMYLAEKYALELPDPPAADDTPKPSFDWTGIKPQASLSTSADDDLNVEGLALSWNKPHRVDAPWRHDPAHPTRLYCDRDGRVHLSVRLALRSSAPGARLRILALRNEEDYFADESVTRPDPDAADGTRLVGRLDMSFEMRAGDWVEIVVSRDGGTGEVTPLPGDSVLLAFAE